MQSSANQNEQQGEPDFGESIASLSPRQREILNLLKDGKANKEIARDLDLSVGTVKQHIVALFRKLGVVNRAQAVAKSYSLDKAEAGRSGRNKRMNHSRSGATSILEKRPAAVLSLKLDIDGDPGREQKFKTFYRIFAEVAFDFGAVFFSHNSGHCELILGVGQVRRHDVLRAVRAAVAIVEDCKAAWGAYPDISGGLAFGALVASTDKSGAWSGEAIAGGVISKAHDLSLEADKGFLKLDGGSRQMIRFLGLDAGGQLPEAIPLSRDFHWRRSPLPSPGKLCGRLVEREQFRSLMLRARDGAGGLVIVDGENGMGRSALLQSFAAMCLRSDMNAETWVCSLPDTQPGAASLGVMEKPGTDFTCDTGDFLKDIERRDNPARSVILIDDIHLLPPDHIDAISTFHAKHPESSLLWVLCGRGRLKQLENLRAKAKSIRLRHLDATEAKEMASRLLGETHPQIEHVLTLANGVPGFLTELAVPYLKADMEQQDKTAIPLTLFSIVTERIERLGLDRRFLHMVAGDGESVKIDDMRLSWPIDDDTLRRELERALKVGVLDVSDGTDGNPRSVGFRHPIVRAAMAAASAGEDGLLQ